MNLHSTSMKPALAVLSLLALLLWAVAVPVAYAAPQIRVGEKAVVTHTGGYSIRIRSGASTSTLQSGTAREGDVVSVLSEASSDGSGRSWYRVQAQITSGWIAADFLEPQSPAPPVERPQSTQSSQSTPQLSGSVRVANTNGNPLNLRFEPSRTGIILAALAPDSTARVVAGPVIDKEGEAWYQLAFGDLIGWSAGRYLAPEGAAQPAPVATAIVKPQAPPAPPKSTQPEEIATDQTGSSGAVGNSEANTGTASQGNGERIVSNAMEYVGYRYRFGGASPSGFDCSGFVYYVMNKSGVPVGRDIYSQLNSGQRVGRSDLQPGDLVFFANTYQAGLSHAGIYIGGGKFVHAENESTGVLVTLMQNPYYASRYYAAVRPR